MSYEFPECDTLDETVAMMHEMYQAAVNQGFSRHQALHIVMGDACCKREDLDQ